MSENINKNSIQSAIINFTSDLEKWVLNPEDKLNDEPTSFVSLLSSTLGKLSGYSFFNMMMSKRELNPNTAIMTKSLLRQLRSDYLKGIYGTPASLSVVMAYPEDDLIAKALPTGIPNQSKLTLGKNTIFGVGTNPPFTIDYNIDIYIQKYVSANGGKPRYSIFARYNLDDPEGGNLLQVTNPFLMSRNDIVRYGKKMFVMYIDAKQYTRSVITKEMSGEAKSISINYTNSLMGFVVLYKPQSSNTWFNVPVYLEGELYTDGVCYTITNYSGYRTIRLKFSKLPGAFNPSTGLIKVVVYTTFGKDGNFSISNVEEHTVDELTGLTEQDLSDRYQEALNPLVATCTIAGKESSGGNNDKSLEEIRELVIESNKGEVITPASLAYAAKQRGFSATKRQHDLLAFSYLLSSTLTNPEDSGIMPSRMINGFFKLKDVPVDTESNSRIIYPADVYKYDENDQKYDLIREKDVTPYKDYYAKYLSDLTKIEYSFPFFIRVKNDATMNVRVYDQSINETKPTLFTYMATSVLDKTSITSVRIERNPLSNIEVNDADGRSGYAREFYAISFTVNMNDVLYDHLKNLSKTELPYAKFRVFLKNKTDKNIYARDVDLKDCIFKDQVKDIECITYLKTNSNILDNEKINLCENSVRKIPFDTAQYPFYYVDNTVDLECCVLFKNMEDEDIGTDKRYEDYLTDFEKDHGYYVGIIYAADDIVLAQNITDYINVVGDLKLTQPIYQRADDDIPDLYSNDVYKTDANGIPVKQTYITKLPNGASMSSEEYVILHHAGDVKRSLDGRVGTFNTLSSVWSSERKDVGIYDIGTVLGGNAIYCMCMYNGLIIFGGEEGRIGCYDKTFGVWHVYNEDGFNNRGESAITSSEDNGPVIKGDAVLGTYSLDGKVKKAAVRGMIVEGDALIVYGDYGRVTSINLTTNGNTSTWKNPVTEAGGDVSTAIYCNNGTAMGFEPIYACVEYTTSGNMKHLVFGGGSGRICSLHLGTGRNEWTTYDTDKKELSHLSIFSDGEERGFKAILSMNKYLESAIYATGVNGISSYTDLSTGKSFSLNDGSVVDNKTMYTSAIFGNNFIQAGKDGYISSYDIVHATWLTSESGSKLSDNGKAMGKADIYACFIYNVDVIFCGEFGRVCDYNTQTNTWENYNHGSGLTNTGDDWIKSSISCVGFDIEQGGSDIYFAGKSGNIDYKYRKGDIIYEDGVPVIKEEASKVLFLKGIPAYSRLFSVETYYENIKAAYMNLITKIRTMNDIFVDTGTLYLGVKTSAGPSKAYYFNNQTGGTIFLDSLSLSFDLGVKFELNIGEDNYPFLIDSIKKSITKYISDVQDTSDLSSITLNLNSMISQIKEDVPGIDYFEIYKVNNYSTKDCQTIHYDSEEINSTINEYLSIQKVVDEDISNFETGEIYFKPNIKITVL